MTTRVAVTHRIDQRFPHPIRFDTHWLRLRPAPHTKARVTAYSLAIHAEPHFLNWLRDPFENYIARLDLPEPVAALGIELELIADLEPVNPFDFLIEPYAAQHPFEYPEQLRKELVPYLQVGTPGPRLRAWLSELDHSHASTIEFLDTLNRRVHDKHRTLPAAMLAPSDLEQVLAQGEGSCWDLAWLLTLSLRQLGHAARIATGYRIWLADGVDSVPDAVTLHAWSETFVPGAGWIGLDPSDGLFINESYIPVATAPDPSNVLPIVGKRDSATETRSEALSVQRLWSRRDAWPYTDTQWTDIQALGSQIDANLSTHSVNLALGVGLSLISATHANEPEWNSTALGPSKRFQAERLLDRLMSDFARGGVYHQGQGEWISGEPLPRWRLSCLFRADGKPAWRDPALCGLGRVGQATLQDANDLALGIARALAVPLDSVVGAYEDGLQQRRNAGPLEPPPLSELRDPARRRALADRLSDTGYAPSGYVLPLRWDHAAQRWSSGHWALRRSRLYLYGGDSPLGYRLPLQSLGKDEALSLEAHLERDPFAELEPLLDHHADCEARFASGTAFVDAAGAPAPRTALSVEARAGQLFVFVPPVADVAHYLQLVAAVEIAAQRTSKTVIIEGYDPPEDPRLLRVALEPDPAVLRLTLPPARSWNEQLNVLRAAYQEAANVGMRFERILADGRRLPSGGGSELMLCGPRPADSPFLIRPDVLRALIAYWQRHPCLSYFFAGHNIGDSSAGPRPDEGRDDALYELSIGLERLNLGDGWAPWHSDRVLRFLLADPTGNIKRSEIRIDQLYSPERAGTRLGRVRIRAFETAPDLQLAAAQVLLVRGLIGRFARYPDREGLTRWGAALRDRFLLPRVLWDDLRSVVQDLNAAGYPFQLEWFEPLLSLRFPILGQVLIGEITLELQTALEPWPVLAEEATGGGMARFIDTANERIQVRLSGLTPGRYLLICNDEQVPLQPTGTHGEYLAGVRFKVANPVATLHPTVFPVESLIFDVFDTWTGRVVGGCTYYPSRPEIWGMFGAPGVTTGSYAEPIEEGPRPQRQPQQPAPLMIPPWSSSTSSRAPRFVPRGSGLETLAIPPMYLDEFRPYLLDLTHRK